MDDLFFENDDPRILSENEVTAMMKNSIEERLLNNTYKLIKTEHKRNAIVIKNVRFNTEALYDSIKRTTGSSGERIEKIFNSTTNKLSFNLMANNKNGLARSQSVNSKRVVKFNYNKVDPEVVKRKTKSALELNRAKKLEEDSLEVYVFEEKRLYDNYLNLCQERDKIPRSLPQRIDVLKKRDPIFAKRYRQFLSAKTCNKAPKFDPRDNLLPMKLPKLTIQREKEKIIKLVQKKPYQKPDYFKIELERINERVKTFVKDFDTQLVF